MFWRITVYGTKIFVGLISSVGSTVQGVIVLLHCLSEIALANKLYWCSLRFVKWSSVHLKQRLCERLFNLFLHSKWPDDFRFYSFVKIIVWNFLTRWSTARYEFSHVMLKLIHMDGEGSTHLVVSSGSGKFVFFHTARCFHHQNRLKIEWLYEDAWLCFCSFVLPFENDIAMIYCTQTWSGFEHASSLLGLTLLWCI